MSSVELSQTDMTGQRTARANGQQNGKNADSRTDSRFVFNCYCFLSK